jgi:hypothetical protein
MKLTPRLQSLGIAALLMTGYGFYAYDYNWIVCKLMDRYWSEDKGRCINPDCRQHDACGQHPEDTKATCETIRPGDSLDKAWYVLGEPGREENGRFIWTGKASGYIAEIERDGEKVGKITCFEQ